MKEVLKAIEERFEGDPNAFGPGEDPVKRFDMTHLYNRYLRNKEDEKRVNDLNDYFVNREKVVGSYSIFLKVRSSFA